MSFCNELKEVRNLLNSKLMEASLDCQRTQVSAKNAYEDALRQIDSLEKAYLEEKGNEPKIVELRYEILCYDREFVIEVNELYRDIAYKIIDVAYSKWCGSDPEMHDLCCEEYINNCLRYYGINYVEKDV